MFSDRGPVGFVGRWSGEDVGLEPATFEEQSKACGVPPEGRTAFRAVAGADDPGNPNPENRVNYAGWGVWAKGGWWSPPPWCCGSVSRRWATKCPVSWEMVPRLNVVTPIPS